MRRFCGLLMAAVLAGSAWAAEGDGFVRVGAVDRTTALASGIEVSSGTASLRVEAMRDDLLRVRMTIGGKWQEDASWAVLPERKDARVKVTAFADAGSVGFDTAALRVRVDRATMRLVVKDAAGNVVSEDAPGRPVTFTGPRNLQGGEFRVAKTMRADEHFFGLGDKTGPLDHRGQSFDNWNTDAYLFQESTDPLYKSIPFFIGESAGRYYGIFLDNTWRTTFDFGKSQRESYSFGSEGGPLDYYILYGPEPKAVVKAWAWLTGPSPLPPLWSLGYQQSRYTYAPQSQLREVADRLRKDRIPTDVLWLDIDFQDRDRPFTTDPVGFKDMPKLVADLKAMQFHTVVITDLHVADVAGQGYAPYDTGKAGDYFVKRADGSEYVGESWPGKVVFPDFTQTKVREWWGTNYKNFVAMGIAGFWNDMNEPSIRNEPTHTMPLDNLHRVEGTGFAARTTSEREIHNVFGAQNARATYEGELLLAPNERPFVMTRAAYAGAQRYSVTWTGDDSSTWNHIRLSTSMIENLGLSGYAFSGADVGGHIGSPGADVLEKWTEVAAFQPIDRNHAAKNSNRQEVWVFGQEREDVMRRFIETRYRLMPYNYTVAEETSRTGLPMVRPLFLEFPQAASDGHPVDLDGRGEFMWGPDLLVAAPAYFEMMNKYPAILPGDVWYDFWTGARVPKGRPLSEMATDAAEFTAAGARHDGGRTPGLTLTAKEDELPVFVRGGAIVPMQAVVQSTEEKPAGPLELRVYPGPDCHGSLYGDDGHTFNFKRGEYYRVQYGCSLKANGVEVKIGAREGGYAPWWGQVEVEVFGAQPGWKVTVGGVATASRYDAASGSLHVVVSERQAGMTLVAGSQ